MLSPLWTVTIPILLGWWLRLTINGFPIAAMELLEIGGNITRNNNIATMPGLRVTRRENQPDTFTTNKISSCGSTSVEFCSRAEASVVEDAKECACQCSAESPVFQDGQGICASQIPPVAGCRFGSLSRKSRTELNPVIHLAALGHTLKWNINLTDSEPTNPDQQCSMMDCHVLTVSGWSSISLTRLGSLRPKIGLAESRLRLFRKFSEPRDAEMEQEGETNSSFLIYDMQWLGSLEPADSLQGRQILLVVVCNATGLLPAKFCLPMRVAGTSGRARSASLLAGTSSSHDQDNVATGVLVAAACGGALGVLYVIVLAIFITSRLRKPRKTTKQHSFSEYPTNSSEDTRNNADCGNSALVSSDAGIDPLRNSQASNSLTYSAACPEETAQRNRFIQPRGPPPSSLTLRYLCSPPPFFLNDVLIVQTPDVVYRDVQMQSVIHKRTENKALPKPPARRRKVFFDPEYLTLELLKTPPDAAEHFRSQIHYMVNITKSRLDRRKFLPNLEMIDEDSSLHRTMSGRISHAVEVSGRHPDKGHDGDFGFCLPSGSAGSPDLDCVVLQVNAVAQSAELSKSSTKTPTKNGKNDWPQILKDEWGSNESLAKVPLRRRIQDAIRGRTIPKKKIKPPTATGPSKTGHLSKIIPAKVMPNVVEPVTKTSSDDEDSDKSSSRSGTGSNPEKDSGIEDDVNSDKSNKLAVHKAKKDAPGIISRKKIVLACATINETARPVKGRSANVQQAMPTHAF